MRVTTHVEQAIPVLRSGGLVAFPTETVYGLGADVENESAVRRIFEAKGRPETHPLIVHIRSSADLSTWAAEVSALARQLAEAFWPGPLTLIVRRSVRVPLAVTGGLETVGLRVPNHPLALELLDRFGGAIAAPSANRFGAVSPTTAEHVAEDLGDRVDLVLDGGRCSIGLESTIVDVSGGPMAILRPGGVTREALEAIVGSPLPLREGGEVRAPGQLESHYAPRARVELLPSGEIAERARRYRAQGLRIGVLSFGEPVAEADSGTTLSLQGSEAEQASRLYQTLRDFDRLGCDVVLASPPPEQGIGLAIGDRLERAAGPRRSG